MGGNMQKIKMGAFALLLISFFSFHQKSEAALSGASFYKGYLKILSTITWIYNPKYKRRPTGNIATFYGNKKMFYYSKRRKINGADVSFGYYLYYAYDLYCLKKTGRRNCLGKRLKVSYRIKGKSLHGTKYFSMNVGGKTHSTIYFQSALNFMYSRLEKMGGQTKLNWWESALVKPKPVLHANTKLHVLYPNDDNFAVQKWFNYDYIWTVLSTLSKNLQYYVWFPYSLSGIKNHSLYYSKSQYQTLKKYRYLRKNKQITAVISGPNTTDAAGITYLGYSKSPYFAMRSRYNSSKNWYSSKAYNNTALIFLHELAHNMNLNHCKSGQSSMCTDNIHKSAARAWQVVLYLSRIGALRSAYWF